MVDFADIRPHRGSQNNGFEELVVQLARRHPPLGATEFRRIEGAGGDAGVEALWLRNDGSAVGIQAKYFLRVRDIDWAQIDESVKTTLKNRPEVNLYRVAVACDLTDRGGAKGQGRTGWRAWEDWVKRWESEALALGRTVSFEPVTASDLVDWLGQPSAAGLARYWFGADVLGLPWFANQVRIASADLGERYTPDQHVVVAASHAFDGVARTLALRSRLLHSVQTTWKHQVSPRSATPPSAIRDAAERADRALKHVYSIADVVNAPATTRWDVEQWISDVQSAEQLLGRLDEEVRKQEREADKSKGNSQSDHDYLGYWRYSIRKAYEALRELARLLHSVSFRADASRVLLVTGEAGTGKSHLLAAEANRAITEGRPALLFLGQQFAQGNPWDQCERSLGLPGWPRDELFGALEAAGEAHGTRTLILIDAVNEGAGANLWRNHLAGFIENLAPYSHIAVVVACRTEYVPFAIPKPVLDAYPNVELRGFATFEEQEAAAVQYLDRRGIVRPAGPLLAPEFSHPLFLKAASDALLQKGIFIFPRGLRGALNILGFYLDSVGSNLMPGSVEPADLSPELRRALAALAKDMAFTKRDYVRKSEAELIISQTFTSRASPPGITWLDVLLRNGILRLDPDPTAHGDSSFVAPDDVARIAFQRFQDHLIVQASLVCSSTSRYLRDTATRGLCRLIGKAPDLHHELLSTFVGVDDLYVLERLLAASFGAACQLGDDPILERMAASTFELIFTKGGPPQHLLARDYALGVLEVAEHRRRLPATINLEEARPPFPAKALRAPSAAALEKRKDKVGDYSIFSSCGEHGDFGRYEIDTAVGDFSATRLKEPVPLSDRNRFDLFVSQVAELSPERKIAFDALEEASREIWSLRFKDLDKGFQISQRRSDTAVKAASKLEVAFLALLTEDERGRYSRDAFDRLFSSRGERDPPTFDPRWAQRWVTARAYSLGWTREMFGDDRAPLNHDRQRARVERVGKKYQWIALYELLAWLSDTHWVKGDWGALPKRYTYPTDIPFQRDLDPTLAADTDVDVPVANDLWQLDFNLRPVADEELTAWARQNDSWQSPEGAIFRKDSANGEWITLYSFQHAVEHFSDRDFVSREIGFRREGFQFVHSLIVRRKDLQPTYDALVAAKGRDTHRWQPSELTDGPYLGEYAWRATWPDLGWSSADHLPGDVRVLRPVVEYWWESHLDASRPDGVRLRFPCPELLRLLSLGPISPRSPDTLRDGTGGAVIVHRAADEVGSSLAIRRDALKRVLIEHELGCLWFVSAERSAWPTGGHAGSSRRWFGSYMLFDGSETRSFSWETPW